MSCRAETPSCRAPARPAPPAAAATRRTSRPARPPPPQRRSAPSLASGMAIRLIEIRTRPRYVVALVPVEHDLVELEPPAGEPGDRPRQIEPPGADEPLVEHVGH